MQVLTFDHPSALPVAALALWHDAGQGNLFHEQPWLWQALPASLQPGDRLQLHLITDDGPDGRPLALLPAVYSRLYASHPNARVLHFLQREEQPYEPIGQAVDVAATAECIAAWIEANPNAVDVVRVSPLDPAQPLTSAIVGALARHGHWVQLYRYANSRFATVAGLTFSQYLAQRPKALRESLELNTRLLLHGGRGEFQLPFTPELIEEAWDHVRYIIENAPEEDAPDPPDYLRAMLVTAADTGTLRLGIFFLDGLPVAMQLWVISAGRALCLRIWAAQGQRAFPIDDVLTQLMALCLIDGDHVDELEFGDVNDEFARDWAPLSRERLGLAAFNRHTLRGVRGALRHIGVQLVKTAPQRLWRFLRARRRA